MTDEKPTVTIYTDGGAKPNPGPGGYGIVLIYNYKGKETTKELSGGAEETTNNRMELTAVIEALRALNRPCKVELYTDSEYVKNGINEWMIDWLRTDFRNGKIQNADLWRILNIEIARHEIRWHWVRGHTGNKHNERADQLAAEARPGSKENDPVPLHSTPDDTATRAYLRVSCKGTPGPGAWAALVIRPKEPVGELIRTGSKKRTYANQLDLLAAIGALRALPEGVAAAVFTGSSYLYDGITKWILGWKKRNWVTKTGGEVQHRDLWQCLDALVHKRHIVWSLVDSNNRPPELERLEEPLQEALRTVQQSTLEDE